MKFCVAQTRALPGDIPGNIHRHCELAERAARSGAGAIVFPELSLTGYEPTLAERLAADANAALFDPLQSAADDLHIAIGAGTPTRSDGAPCISLLLFRPQAPRRVYSKHYLHADELPYFDAGENFPCIALGDTRTALAICYELSVFAHADTAAQHGAQLYIASVAKTPQGAAAAHRRLAEIARHYAMPVMMSNCIGSADGEPCGGGSAIWNSGGECLAQLDAQCEGLLYLDTATDAAAAEVIGEGVA